jgi:hypothetical protein
MPVLGKAREAERTPGFPPSQPRAVEGAAVLEARRSNANITKS